MSAAITPCVTRERKAALSAGLARTLCAVSLLLFHNSTSRVTVHRKVYHGAHWALQWVGAAPYRCAAYSGRKRSLGCDM
jgi:hypothetical protein